MPKADSCTAAKNLSGPGLLCIRPHESSALQALGRLGCVEIKNSGIALAFPGNRRFIDTAARLSGPFSGVVLARSRKRFVTIPVVKRCSLTSWNSDSQCGGCSLFNSLEGPRNAHIGRSILRRALAASHRRYREPEGRQWQIHVCHAHHCRAA